MNVAFTFGKFITGALASAALTVFGVWTVVGLALGGMSTAIDATNDGITRLDSRVALIESRIDSRFESINTRLDAIVLQIGQGFKETRTELQKKASLDTPDKTFATSSNEPANKVDTLKQVDSSTTSSTNSDISELLQAHAIDEALTSGQPYTVFVPTTAAFAEAKASGFLADKDVTNPAVLDTLLKSYRTTGAVSPASFQEFASKSDSGFSFKVEDGRTLRAKMVDGVLTIVDGNGDSATVVDGKQLTHNLTVFTLDKALK